MLRPEEVELIHREIDGEGTPQDRVAFQALVARHPEARTLAAELRELAVLLGKVEQRAPPPGLRPAVLDALREHSRTSPETAAAGNAVHALLQWFVFQLKSATIRMEQVMITKRTLVMGSTMVAAVAVIAALLTGYPPTGREGGTMGGLQNNGGDTIAGVQQASRFRNKAVTERDVTLGNPDVQLLFQNHKILSLVKSDVFREAMRNDAFRNLQSNEAFARLQSNEAFLRLQSNEAFLRLQSNEAFARLMASDAYRSQQATEAYSRMQSSEAFRELQSNDAFRGVMASEAFRTVLSSDIMRAALANEAFRSAFANEAFRSLFASEAFRAMLAKDAYHQLQSSELFRSVSRSQSASEAFLSQAMRVEQ